MKRFVFAVTVMAAAVALAGEFKAGFARVDITPPLGSFMPGYYQDRRAKEVLDPLEINMVAFSDGARTALIAQVDTEGISDEVADLMRDAAAKATGVARGAVIVHASHTHDGGFLERTLSGVAFLKVNMAIRLLMDRGFGVSISIAQAGRGGKTYKSTCCAKIHRRVY